MDYYRKNLDLARCNVGRILSIHLFHRFASAVVARGYYRVRPRLREIFGSVLLHHFYGLFHFMLRQYYFLRRAKHALLRALR